MFGFFKKPSAREQLEKKYRELLEKAHRLSTVDRKKSDEVRAEAEEVLQQLDKLPH